MSQSHGPKSSSSHGHWKRLGDGSLLTEDADEGLGHILPIAVYLKTLAILLVLTVITVVIAQVNFGQWNAVVALTVASIKALLVALFFMHLKFEGRLIILFAIYPVVLLFLFVGSNVADVKDRQVIYPSFGPDAVIPAPKPIIIGGHVEGHEAAPAPDSEKLTGPQHSNGEHSGGGH